MGGTAGGPIRRNKLFYFGSWERNAERQGIFNSYTVPTARMRNGDFSEVLALNSSFRIYDPQANGKAELSLWGKADRALVEKQVGRIVLVGSVELQDAAGTEIRSERIEYDEQEERVEAPGDVWVRARDTVHEGRGLVYSIPERTFTMQAPRFYQ